MLCGLAAAWAWGLVPGPAPQPEVRRVKKGRIRGIRVHRSGRLDPGETTTWRRIPITTVPRTLVDLASRLSFDDLSRAVHEADVRHGTRAEHIDAVLDRYPNATGGTTLRAIAGAMRPSSSASSRRISGRSL